MQILNLGHVNICTPLVEATVDFFAKGLGMEPRPGPAMSAELQNYWLYNQGGRALIHVIGIRPGDAARPEGASRLDHFALDCAGLDACIERLDRLGIAFDRLEIASRKLVQLNLSDPNGIKVELTFDAPA
ncbi:MAG: glyoxalase/bleomycin resistance protein/dioxygenase [Alphaproteobacteria bacterium]|nr:glyoxalase/bleomycin resistance protein/dioxygenase [Alphaproteobacteria bacterium]MDB5722754.1 glyoxalase/bleomycin resistance protein/dioxygenase [Alphaproteobacteria bacterium]